VDDLAGLRALALALAGDPRRLQDGSKLPLRTARSELDVQFPVAVVALVKCIVKVSEMDWDLEAWATSGTATAVGKIMSVAIVRFISPLSSALLRGALPPALPSDELLPTS
jgi:hypothetical protein